MKQLELSFASVTESFSVRRFAVREAMSQLFEVEVVARSPSEDVDLEAIVGRAASFRLGHAVGALAGGALVGGAARRWTGICSSLEQVEAEPTGLSTYHVTLVPALWLLTQRRNHRIFQRLSVLEIVDQLLGEWAVDREWRVERPRYPKLEYRVQYGETDHAFMSRLLEEAGIAYWFVEGDDGTRVVLGDAPQHDPKIKPPRVSFVDHPNESAGEAFVTKVRLTHEVRPGRLTIRDFDFRAKPDYGLFGASRAEAPVESRLEQYHYAPGAFVDDKAGARAAEKQGDERAGRWLESARVTKRRVKYRSNLVGLTPGAGLCVDGHPHPELAPDRALLVTRLSLDGTHDGAWTVEGEAVFAAVPYRPAFETPKPRIHGVQSALVVGPPGQEIHTDEYGRVRVQFHWDRGGVFDDNSSCWMRVSQGWAGTGFGLITVPRVGQEVLVGFFEGDPDQPVIVGRMFNGAMRVPYDLPENRAVSGWKTDTSPGSGGFNEIRLDDSNGRELVAIQAERNLSKLTKLDETEVIGRNHAIAVGADRLATVGAVDATTVGVKHAVAIARPADMQSGAPTHIEMIDKRIHLTTGEASLTLEGPNITLRGKGLVIVQSDEDDVTITGGPWVKINCDPPETQPVDTVTSHHITGIVRDQDGAPLAGRRLVVQSCDGVVQQVTTDASGRYLAIVPPGSCRVTLAGSQRYGKSARFDDMTLEPETFDDSGSLAE